MRVLFLLLVAVLLNISGVSSITKCPSDKYQFCVQSGICHISDRIKTGFISYGADGHWTLIPFTNDKTDGTDITFNCDYGLGDILYGSTKYCCIIGTDTGFSNKYLGSPGGNYRHGIETQVSGVKAMRYGTDQRYFYRVIKDAISYCDEYFFGDSAYGIPKYCDEYSSVPQSLAKIPDSDWEQCGIGERSACTGLDTVGAQWVRYGDNGKYYYRLVIATDGRVNCDYRFFGDPRLGAQKYCFKSPAQFTFTNIVGQWKKLYSCAGCASSVYKRTSGITQLDAREITDTWQYSLTATMARSYGMELSLSDGKIGGTISGSTTIELSATVAYSTAYKQVHSISHTAKEETTMNCAKQALYQWETGATQNNGVTEKKFGIKSADFFCMEGAAKPKCPPGYCKKETKCQTCTKKIEAEQTPIAKEPNYNDYYPALSRLPQYPNYYQWDVVLFCSIATPFIILCIAYVLYSMRVNKENYAFVKDDEV